MGSDHLKEVRLVHDDVCIGFDITYCIMISIKYNLLFEILGLQYFQRKTAQNYLKTSELLSGLYCIKSFHIHGLVLLWIISVTLYFIKIWFQQAI